MLKVQAWASLGILLLLCLFAMFERWKVHLAHRATAQTEAQIRLSQQRLVQLSEKLKYEQELRRQDQIVARLGIGVDTSRLLKALEDAMTPEMSLTGLSLETVQQARPGELVSNRRTAPAADPFQDMDRRLKVLVDGVAPTDLEAATLMEHLLKVNCFENVAFAYLREGRTRDGHVMREFEVTFELNLNPPTEGRP
jgi:hypothetical protein